MAKKSMVGHTKKLINAKSEEFFKEHEKMIRTYASYALKYRVKESYEDLLQDGYEILCRATTEFDEAHESGASFKTFLHLRLRSHFMKWNNSDISLEAPLGKANKDGEKISLLDVLPSKELDPYERASTKEMWDCVCSFPIRLKAVLLMRYMKGLTLEETGKHLNLTKERIRQIEAIALKQLRNKMLAEAA